MVELSKLDIRRTIVAAAAIAMGAALLIAPPRAQAQIFERDSDEAGARSAEDRRRLHESLMTPELREAVSTSTEGLTVEPNPLGGVIVHMNGRFQSIMIAEKQQDGSVATVCSPFQTDHHEPVRDGGEGTGSDEGNEENRAGRGPGLPSSGRQAGE